ncbi:MAG TPA: hypothetical protein VHA15_02695 [Burkholderiales bacterium]|nr:hypothetical protein [Burkholderiales bacterium]
MNTTTALGMFAAILLLLPGCDAFTDPATRIAGDIVAGESRLGREEGAKSSIRHKTPSKGGECEGAYKVQFDKVGALVIWCYDGGGNTVSSHITTSHGRTVDTAQTWILDKPAGSTLTIELERRGGRSVIVDVR